MGFGEGIKNKALEKKIGDYFIDGLEKVTKKDLDVLVSKRKKQCSEDHKRCMRDFTWLPVKCSEKLKKNREMMEYWINGIVDTYDNSYKALINGIYSKTGLRKDCHFIAFGEIAKRLIETANDSDLNYLMEKVLLRSEGKHNKDILESYIGVMWAKRSHPVPVGKVANSFFEKALSIDGSISKSNLGPFTWTTVMRFRRPDLAIKYFYNKNRDWLSSGSDELKLSMVNALCIAARMRHSPALCGKIYKESGLSKKKYQVNMSMALAEERIELGSGKSWQEIFKGMGLNISNPCSKKLNSEHWRLALAAQYLIGTGEKKNATKCVEALRDAAGNKNLFLKNYADQLEIRIMRLSDIRRQKSLAQLLKETEKLFGKMSLPYLNVLMELLKDFVVAEDKVKAKKLGESLKKIYKEMGAVHQILLIDMLLSFSKESDFHGKKNELKGMIYSVGYQEISQLIKMKK